MVAGSLGKDLWNAKILLDSREKIYKMCKYKNSKKCRTHKIRVLLSLLCGMVLLMVSMESSLLKNSLFVPKVSPSRTRMEKFLKVEASRVRKYWNQSVVIEFTRPAKQRPQAVLKAVGKMPMIQGPVKNLESRFNGDISLHKPNPGAYYSINMSAVYIMSAIGHNSSCAFTKSPNIMSSAHHCSYIVFTGWMKLQYAFKRLHCCLLNKDQTLMSFESPKRLVWNAVGYNVRNSLMATKFYCPIPYNVSAQAQTHAQDLPMAVAGTLSLSGTKCRERNFSQVVYPLKEKINSLAICSKIVYGSVEADRVLEWLEIQRFIGVDKVVFYYYNLNSATMRVLKYYEEKRFVELLPFDYPQPDQPFRYVGQKRAMPFIDEQVAVYDCIERLHSYTYVGVIDVDEILYFQGDGNHNLKSMMAVLRKKYPLGSGFSFKTELFVTDWADELRSDKNHLWHTRFLTRTQPMKDRTKNVFINDRVILGSVWTHNFTSRPGYKKINVPAKLAVLKHFRRCRPHWIRSGTCFSRRRYNDTTVMQLFNDIQGNVEHVHRRILKKQKQNKA